MRNRLILVAVLLLNSCLSTEAQKPAAQIALAQTSPGLTMILSPAPRVRLSPIVLPLQFVGGPLPHPAFLLAAVYRPDPGLESRLPMEEFRTPFLTESSFLVAHLWRGLKLDIFENTLHSRGLQLGSPTSEAGFHDFRPSSNDQAGIANSVGHNGISLRYSFGRDAETRKPAQLWHCVSWIVGNGRGCPL
jgi:hypothetical protein